MQDPPLMKTWQNSVLSLVLFFFRSNINGPDFQLRGTLVPALFQLIPPFFNKVPCIWVLRIMKKHYFSTLFLYYTGLKTHLCRIITLYNIKQMNK